MKRFFAIAAAFLLCISLTGCKKSLPALSNPTPLFSDDALHTSGSYNSDVHLTSVNYTESGGEHTFKLNFLSADGLPLKELPKYQISIDENPSRLLVRAAITSFDISELTSFANCSYYMLDENGFSVFCAQFGSPIVFSVSEDKSELTVQISSLASNTEDGYFLIGTDDSLAQFGFTQAYCDDSLVYMISDAYETDSLAQSALSDFLNKHELSEGIVRIAKMSNGKLTAEYLSSAQLMAAQNAPKIFDANNNAVTAAMWAYGAKPICEFTEKNYLFSKTSSVGAEKLVTYSINGESKELKNSPTGHCVNAKIRNDGELAAMIMEQNGEYLSYVYDITRCETISLAELGMGVFTSDIAWGDDDCLYAISGDSSYQTIMKFDPIAHAMGQTCVFTIGSEDIMNGQLFAGAGRLYYLNNGSIWTCLLSGQSKFELLTAESFLVSPNGKYLAAQVFDEEGQAGFILYDVENAQEASLFDGEALSYVFSADSGILHFTVFNEQDPNSPAQLISYNILEGKSYKQAFMNTDMIFPMPAGNAAITLYLTDGTPVTYTIKCAYN